MKKTSLMMVITFFILVNSNLIGQERTDGIDHQNILNTDMQEGIAKQNKSNLRKCFYNISVGFFEYLNLGIGGQISENFSALIIYGFSWNRGNGFILPGTGSGSGVKFNFYNNLAVFNKISFEYIYYLNSAKIFYKDNLIMPRGSYFEVTLGSENIKKEDRGNFNIIWEVGIGISTIQHKKSLVLPSMKIGISKYIF